MLWLVVALGFGPVYGQFTDITRAAVDQGDTSIRAVPGEIIVRYVDGLDARERVRVRADLALAVRQPLDLIHAEVLAVDSASMPSVLSALASDHRVAWAEPNYLVRADVIPSDPEFSLQWGLHNVGQTGGAVDADVDAVEAWDIQTGRSVLIGIIDSGIDTAHPDLRANLWTNPGEIPDNGIDDDGNGFIDDIHGWDFHDYDNDPHDENGHGTHVAGIVAAAGNNGIGITGVAWEAQLIPLRFLSADGFGPTSRAVLALQYAIQAGARLTCNSWGGGAYSQALRDAIDSAGARGMLFVAAAGNDRKNTDITPHYPSAYPASHIIAVAATDDRDRFADEALWGSNWGPLTVDLGAPGVSVYSTLPGGYGYLSGTSMAAPHVAGAAALLWSEFPGLSHHQVKDRLMATGDALPDLAARTVSGKRLNVAAALADYETIQPAPVTDLTVARTEGSRVTLRWTAPGDDGAGGRAARYRLAQATSPFDSAGFDLATPVSGLPAPGVSGAADSFTVLGLDFGTTYYFGLVTEDDWFNASPLSNLAVTTTLGPPQAEVTVDTLTADASAGTFVEHAFEVSNLGEGELIIATDVDYPFTRPLAEAAVAGEMTAETPRDILLVYADNGATGLAAILEGYPDIGLVDTWFAGAVGGSIPSYADVAPYDVIVAWNNKPWADTYEIGELLALFIDSGGAVISLVDCWGTRQFVSRGRYFDSAGYSPFISVGEALFEVRTLGGYRSDHPVMRDVHTLAIGSYHNQVELAAGALDIARWNDGTPLVAAARRTVAINVWPGDGYHWLGDFPTLIHNAIRYATGAFFWFRVEPDTREIAPGAQAAFTARFDAAHLVEGTYAAGLQLATNDPAAPRIDLPVRLDVEGTPRIQPDVFALDFGDVFLGHPVTRMLEISNPGTAVLDISEIRFDLDHFSSTVDQVAVDAGERVSIPVEFAPPSVGAIWGSLYLTTNDPDVPVVQISLHAETVSPPNASVTPGSLSAGLNSGGSARRTLVIANGGVGNLEFDLRLRGARPPDAATDDGRTVNAAGAATDDLTPIRLVRPGALTGLNAEVERPDSVRILAWVGFADRSPGNELGKMVAALSEHVSGFVLDTTTETDPLVLDSLLYDYHVFLVPEQENALPELLQWGAAWSPVLFEFVSRGGTVVFAQEWGNSAGFIRSTGLLDVQPRERGSNVRLELVRPDHPLALGLPDTLRGTNLTAWYTYGGDPADVIVTDSASGLAVVVSREIGSGRAHLLGFDYFTYNDAMARLLANAVSLAYREFSWIDAFPARGTIRGGDSVVVDVTLSGRGLEGGDYYAEISVSTNDPRRPRLPVYAQLQVTDAPHLETDPAQLDFGTVFVGSADTLQLVFSNGGSLPLRVDELASSDPSFGLDGSAFDLEPGERILRAVVFTPAAAGTDTGSIMVTSNDPDEPVTRVIVRGEGSAAPLLFMDGDTTRSSLYTGARDTMHVRVENRGGSPLTYRLVPLITEAPVAGLRHGVRGGHADAASDSTVAAYMDDWTDRAPMPHARTQFGVVAHPDGRIYVFGGWGDYNAGRPELDIFDPELNTWTGGRPMPEVDQGMATTVDQDGRIYSFSAHFEPSYRYDPATDEWETIEAAPIPLALEAGAAPGPDGRLYLIGGEGDGPDDPLDRVQIYDPARDVWSLGAPMPTPRYQLAVSRGPGGLIYAVGGRQGFQGDPLAVVEIYDPVRDAWSTAAPMPTPRCQLALGEGADDRLYAVGGRREYLNSHGEPQITVEIYDPARDVWMAGPSLPAPRGALEIARQGSRLYVLGGSDSAALATNQALHTLRWVTPLPAAGAVAPGETADVGLVLDAYGLGDGLHRAEVHIATNDPMQPHTRHEVELQVTGAPDLRHSAGYLDFDTVTVGETIVQRFTLSNVGTAALSVRAEAEAAPSFAVSPTSLVLEPGADSIMRVTFQPEGPGAYSGSVQLFTDDPDAEVAEIHLAGTGAPAAELTLAPDSLAFALQAGLEQEASLVLHNPGQGTLHWSIDALTAAPTARFGWAAATREAEAPAAARESLGVELATDLEMAPVAAQLARLDGVRIGLTDPRFTPVYSRIRSDLEERGAIVHNVLRPFTAEHLDSIDVLAIDIYVRSLFPNDIEALRAWLAGGKGLLLQNNWTMTLPEASELLVGTGVTQYGATERDALYTRILDHPTTVGVDSVQSLSAALFLDVAAPAIPLVLDDAGRAHAAATRLGQGRVLVFDNEVARDANLGHAGTRLFVNRIFDWLTFGSMVTADPLEGSLAPGARQEVRVRTETAYLVEGAYRQPLRLRTNVPGDSLHEVPVTLQVAGVPRIAVDTDTLDFKTAFVNYGREVKLPVRNSGTARLSLLRLSVEGNGFSADSLPFSIPVFGVADIRVRVVPDAPGDRSGILRIESDAANAPLYEVPLRARGVEPPVLQLEQDSVHVELFSGDSTNMPVRVANRGVSDLDYRVHVDPATDLLDSEAVGDRVTRMPVPAAVPAGKDGRAHPAAGAAVMQEYAGEDVRFGITSVGEVYPFLYPGDTAQLWWSGYAVSYVHDQADRTKSVYFGFGPVIQTDFVELVNDTLQVIVRWEGETDDGRIGIRRLFTFERREKYVSVRTRLINLTADTLENVVFKSYADWDIDVTHLNDSWDYDRERHLVYGWDRRWTGLASAQVPAYMDIEGRNDYFRRGTTVDFPAGPVTTYDGQALLHFDLGDLPPEGTYDILTTLAVGDSLSDLRHQVDRGLQLVKWLATTTGGGRLSRDSISDVGLRVSARSLNAGDYAARLRFTSNDPARPEVTVPVTLRVDGAPAIVLDSDTLDYGDVYRGYPVARTLTVSNRGTDVLHVMAVSTDRPELSVDVDSLRLAPGEDSILWITFTPIDTGAVVGRVTLYSDDSVQATVGVAIRAHVALPPKLGYGPESYDLRLGAGDSTTRSLHLANTGAGPLLWQLPGLEESAVTRPVSAPEATDAAAAVPASLFVSARPAEGTVMPGRAQDATLVITAQALAPGAYTTELVLAHNDPAADTVRIPMHLDVFEVQRGDANADSRVNAVDVIYMVNSLWKAGPDPFGTAGDLTCDLSVSVADIMFLIDYIYKSGPAPACE